MRSLDSDRPKRSWLIWMPTLLAAWTAWMFGSRVPVFEVTDRGRLEVQAAAHTLSALSAGRIASSKLQLGRDVAAGETLVELDSEPAQLALKEKLSRVAALQSRRTGLDREIASERQTREAMRQARTRANEEADAQIAKAESQIKFARADLDRNLKLRGTGAASQADLDRTQLAVDTSQAALTEVRASRLRNEQDRRALESEQETRIVRLEREATEIEGDLLVEQAAIRRLEREIAECRLTAPVAGRIGDVANVRVGTVVKTAEPLCSIVPPGTPRAVAWFPTVVVGRIKPGQAARLRLAGFPWTQYGVVAARVSDVGTEPRDGFILVELALEPSPTSVIPLEHGLTGSVEIEVERVAPVVLALRAAGQFLGTRREGAPSTKSESQRTSDSRT